jgi:hypothetical protein
MRHVRSGSSTETTASLATTSRTDNDSQCHHNSSLHRILQSRPSFCAHTPFALAPSEVYTNAWSPVKSLVQRCYNHGIGVLLDMHALRGGANTEIHSEQVMVRQNCGTTHSTSISHTDAFNSSPANSQRTRPLAMLGISSGLGSG